MYTSILSTCYVLLITLSSTFATANPTQLSRRYAIKEYHFVPRGWRNIGRAPADHIINLNIGLTQSRFDELEKLLYEVSDPQHTRYGHHLTAGQVHELIKPDNHVSKAVHEWLEEHNIQEHRIRYSPAGDWLRISLSVLQVEKLLGTEYSVFEHEDGSLLVRTQSWSLPLHLHDYVTAIQPTNSWARMNPKEQKREVEKRESHYIDAADIVSNIPAPSPGEIGKVCNFSAVTPNCLRTLYGTINYTPRSNGRSRMGLTNYLEEYNNRSDTRIFLQKYRPETANSAYQFREISIANGQIDNGTNHASDGKGLEGNLDAQYMLGIAWPLKLTAYSTGGRLPGFIPSLSTPDNTDEPYLTWVNYVLGQDPKDVPQIISTSYGDDEQTVPRSYAQAVCRQFAQLGARGVSLLFASGDYGVGQNNTCYSNKDNSTYMFLPSFPNSCPYVTNVGGTYLYPEQAVFAVLSSGNIFASGAGFSNYFDQPQYQQSAVNNYLAGLKGLNNGFYNKKGRAYPDISCVGQRFPTIWNGTTRTLVGTSGSTPICSAVLALVNDALIAAGKPVLGFLNPWLYGGGYKAFTDVTNGSSYGCRTNGFPARPGWDAVTGFGTPYLPKILEALGVNGKGGYDGGGYGGGGYGGGGYGGYGNTDGGS